MLTFFIIACVIAVALAPLMHMAPSKRARRIASLREYAALHGLFVEFRKTPGGDELLRRLDISPQSVIYYGKRLPPSRAEPIKAINFTRDDYGWRAVGQREKIPSQLQDLAPQVFAASVDESSCGVYWTESGDEALTEQICQSLESWASELLQP